MPKPLIFKNGQLDPEQRRELERQAAETLRSVIESISPETMERFSSNVVVLMRQTFKGLAELGNRMSSWVTEYEEGIFRFIDALTEIAAAFEANTKLIYSRGEHIGSLGWTVSPAFTLTDNYRLAFLSNAIMADTFMLGIYEKKDPSLSEMEKRFCNDPILSELQKIALSQVFRAIRREDFVIVLPTLMILLEAVIRPLHPQSQGSRRSNVGHMLTSNQRLKQDVEKNVFAATMCFSLIKFVADRWMTRETGSHGDVFMKRNDMLHGRVDFPNERTEVLRFLTALETALALRAELQSLTD